MALSGTTVEGTRQDHKTGYRESAGRDAGPNTTLSCTHGVNGMGRSSHLKKEVLRKQNSSTRLERLNPLKSEVTQLCCFLSVSSTMMTQW